jgi:hypothetical protein
MAVLVAGARTRSNMSRPGQAKPPEIPAFIGKRTTRFEDGGDIVARVLFKKPTDGLLVAEFQKPFDDVGFMALGIESSRIDIPEKAPYFTGNHALIIAQTTARPSLYLTDIIAVRRCF